MTADPKIRIGKIIKSAVADAPRRAPLHAVFVDRPFYDQVCRAYAVSPSNAPNGMKIGGVPVKPFDVLPPA